MKHRVPSVFLNPFSFPTQSKSGCVSCHLVVFVLRNTVHLPYSWCRGGAHSCLRLFRSGCKGDSCSGQEISCPRVPAGLNTTLPRCAWAVRDGWCGVRSPAGLLSSDSSWEVEMRATGKPQGASATSCRVTLCCCILSQHQSMRNTWISSSRDMTCLQLSRPCICRELAAAFCTSVVRRAVIRSWEGHP